MGKAVPVIHFDERAAQDAFEAHAAMLIAEKANPKLSRNDYWQALRDTAKARFLAAFDVL
jgi:predicted metal-dependent hydrolase